MLRHVIVPGLLAAAFLLAGCGSSKNANNNGAAPTATSAATTSATAVTTATAARVAATSASVSVQIKLFDYQPNPLTVPVGTTVTWVNEDAIEHSVTSGTPPTPDGSFNSGFFTQGQSWSFTFRQKGDFRYFCMRHNFMTGEIVVQ